MAQPSAKVARFAAHYDFPLDAYQVEACEHLAAGRGVLVAAPTGAGKTVVGEFAVHLAHSGGGKCFYTTPIKALSNQKFHDLTAWYGPDDVGLLTGDLTVNGEARIVVMTTEVLRNMIYAGSPTLRGLDFVVMDEVHYLSDRFRGPVWEEVILGLDEGVKLVGLSATVSNVEEFGAWLDEVHGPIGVVVSEQRPVPLFQHVYAGKRLYDLFGADGATDGSGVNPQLVRLARDEGRLVRDDARRPRGRSGRGKKQNTYGSGNLGGAAHGRFAEKSTLVPRRATVIASLAERGLLPAIYFIFSRQGCDQAVARLADDGVRLTTREERQALREIAGRHAEGLTADDLDALSYGRFLDAFQSGVAAHHAGLLPTFKLAVEEAFGAGLLKVVFATETLALGINMPAKTVVLDKLVKFNGESHADVTPGEYTQLTGRAGRRGIDVEGHAVVTWQAGLDPRSLAGLASRRTYPLRSAFTPTYNMAVNLIQAMGYPRARAILERSFAQFQKDYSAAQRHSERVRSRVLVRKFERICVVLESLGYVQDEPDGGLQVTEWGRRLTRIYGMHDLVAAEAVRLGLFDNLPLPVLAAVLSTIVYEHRANDRTVHRLPDRATERVMGRLRDVWREIRLVERDNMLDQQEPLDIGFAEAAYHWADGASLGAIVDNTGLAAGDFVRWVRQVIDCAGQLADATRGTPLAARCRDLMAAMRRGVVVVDDPDE